ncbi:MAG: hypothetical protein V4596_05500 [Bdellovibrionota bacterium]
MKNKLLIMTIAFLATIESHYVWAGEVGNGPDLKGSAAPLNTDKEVPIGVLKQINKKCEDQLVEDFVYKTTGQVCKDANCLLKPNSSKIWMASVDRYNKQCRIQVISEVQTISRFSHAYYDQNNIPQTNYSAKKPGLLPYLEGEATEKVNDYNELGIQTKSGVIAKGIRLVRVLPENYTAYYWNCEREMITKVPVDLKSVEACLIQNLNEYP